MRINSINKKDERYFLDITFSNEDEVQDFLKKILVSLKDLLSVNCMITDLDTSYKMYIDYFPRKNYYIVDRITRASIYAYELNDMETGNVVSNWGFYTYDAILAFGKLETDYIEQKSDCMEALKRMPIVINQVLDCSLDISIEKYYYEKIRMLFQSEDSIEAYIENYFFYCADLNDCTTRVDVKRHNAAMDKLA